MEENEEAMQSLEETTTVYHSHRPVELHLCKGNILVWNADDVRLLRETHHIVGTLVGSLPRSPRQNAQLSLPLQLLPEEAAVLIEYDVAKLMNVKIAKPSAEDVSAFERARQRSFREQQALWDALSLKKKQDFEHVIAVGRTTKKHRRAERAKKEKKRGKATPAVGSSGDCNERCSLEDGDDNTMRVPEDAVTVATELRDGLGEQISAAGSGASSNTSLAMSAKSKYASLQEEKNNSKGVASVTSRCIETSKSSPADCGTTSDTRVGLNGRTEKTCSRTHPTQDDLTESQPLCEADSTVNRSGTVDGVGEETDPVGENNRPTIVDLKSEVDQMPLGLESGTSQQNLFTEYENRKVDFDGEGISDARSKTSPQTAEAKGRRKRSNIPQSALSEIGKDSTLSERHSGTSDDPGALSNPEPDCATNGRGMGESPLMAQGIIKPDEVDVFKRPPDPQPRSGYLVHLVTASPDTPRQQVPEWSFPGTRREVLKYRIFKDLWETGYYLTSGCKFGGDFLVYPGDPFLYHSYFIAICVPHGKALSTLDLITYGRLGTNVKKTVILCSVDDGDEVVYTSLQWTGFS